MYLAHRVVVMASKPGRVMADIAVDSPHPHSPDDRTSAQFNRYCRDVSHSLSEAMDESLALAL